MSINYNLLDSVAKLRHKFTLSHRLRHNRNRRVPVCALRARGSLDRRRARPAWERRRSDEDDAEAKPEGLNGG